jgi:hypothetical protein
MPETTRMTATSHSRNNIRILRSVLQALPASILTHVTAVTTRGEEPVPDDQDLEGLDPYGLMARGGPHRRFVSTLDDADWQQPSRCAGWSIRDLAPAASEEYNRACLDGTVSTFLGALGGGVTDLNGANELGIRDFDDVATPELLETWRTVVANVADSADGGDVDSSVGASRPLAGVPSRARARHPRRRHRVPIADGEEPAHGVAGEVRPLRAQGDEARRADRRARRPRVCRRGPRHRAPRRRVRAGRPPASTTRAASTQTRAYLSVTP